MIGLFSGHFSALRPSEAGDGRGRRAAGRAPLLSRLLRACLGAICLIVAGALVAVAVVFAVPGHALAAASARLLRERERADRPNPPVTDMALAGNVIDLGHERLNRLGIGPLSPGNCGDSTGGDAA